MVTDRRYDIDWLRILLFALLVPHHAAVGFVDFGEDIYGIVNDTLAGDGLGIWIYFNHGWRLPSLFLIAGIGTAFATRRGVDWRFMGQRLWRLLLPVAFGLIFLNAIARYAIHLSLREAGPVLGPVAFWFDWITTLEPFDVMHLWFLVNLAVYTLLIWPLLAVRNRIAACRFPAGLLLTVIIIAVTVIAVLTKPWGAAIAGDGYQFPWYFGIFAGGVLIGLHAGEVLDLLARRAFWFLGLGIVTFLIEGGMLGAALERSLDYGTAIAEGGWASQELAPAYGLFEMAFASVEGLNTWAWSFAVTGLAARYLRRPTPLLAELTRAVFPFYVLHFPVVLVGLAMLTSVGWPWGFEFMLLTVGTYVATGVLYLIVRMTGPFFQLVGGRTPPGLTGAS